MDKNIVWVDNNNSWESNYLEQLVEGKHIYLERNFDKKNINNVFALVINEDGNQNITEKYLDFIKRYKPKVLIHNSDEYYICKEIVDILYPKFQLVLKQYSCKYYPGHTNVRRIPIGFNNGICKNIFDIPNNKERKYFWSFIGNYRNKNFSREKNDRCQMVEKFIERIPNHYISDSGTKEEIKNIYKESKFVPIGANLLQGKVKNPIVKHNVWIDCFRTYEAITCGAIPVQTGNEDSIKELFHGCIPPIIYEETWDLLIDKLEKMTEEEIVEQRNKCIDWWYSEMKSIQEQLKKIEFKPKSIRKKRIL